MDLVHDSGRSSLLFMLGAFIVCFAVTRGITKLIRSGRGPFKNVESGGLHIHHLVPGIFLLLIAGAAEFVVVPHGMWRDATAAAFGVGAALTLDEFALWLHLKDVYWTDEGRVSVDAVVFAAGIGLVALVASNPFAPQQGESHLFFGGFIALNLCFALVAVLKERLFLGVGGVMIPFLALVASFRLARPGSFWFRRFYRAGSPKNVKATKRAKQRGALNLDRIVEKISGMPPKAP